MLELDANTLQAEDWLDLQEFLFREYEQDIDRYRSRYAYRGMAVKDMTLTTSLQRIGRRPSEVEEHILRNFRKYAPVNTIIGDYDNIWNWMSIGQHHGLPTRLLDWSYSPNVALHFMTEFHDSFHLDGVIWMVDFVQVREMLPECLQDTIFRKSLLTYSCFELQELIGNSLAEIENFTRKHGNAFMFMEPPSLDDRMVNQFALFSFMLDPDADKMDWLNNHPRLYKKIIIPAQLKWEIRDKLDQANISERIMYPGLDGISRWLKRWYSEKNSDKQWRLDP